MRSTRDPGTRIDCGLAGTVLRFVPPVAALSTETVTFDGDEQARSRPIAPLLKALRGLGVDVDGDALPFTVRGSGSVAGGTVEIDASASSQFVSGLLLSGAAFTNGLTIVHTGESVPSAPHVAMTVAMLRDAGVDVDDTHANRWQVSPGPIAARHWSIEPDLSNAVPFLAAAVATGGAVRIAGWPSASVQPADTILAILQKLGSAVRHGDSYLEVQGFAAHAGLDVDLHDVGELTPAVAALAALAPTGSVSQLRGIAHLRGHETDRLAALVAEINGLGGQCEETPDGLLITANRCTAGCGGPTPTTGWRPPVPSSGCGWPVSRWRTSAPRRRRCPTSRRCGPTCWRAIESSRVRRVRRPGPARQRAHDRGPRPGRTTPTPTTPWW